jgi:hypothetical protein
MQTTSKLLILAALSAALLSCGKHEMSEKERKDASTPAGKVGQVAYEAAKVSGKVAKSAGKELSKAAHEAHEGWKEAAEKDKAKH